MRYSNCLLLQAWACRLVCRPCSYAWAKEWNPLPPSVLVLLAGALFCNELNRSFFLSLSSFCFCKIEQDSVISKHHRPGYLHLEPHRMSTSLDQMSLLEIPPMEPNSESLHRARSGDSFPGRSNEMYVNSSPFHQPPQLQNRSFANSPDFQKFTSPVQQNRH